MIRSLHAADHWCVTSTRFSSENDPELTSLRSLLATSVVAIFVALAFEFKNANKPLIVFALGATGRAAAALRSITAARAFLTTHQMAQSWTCFSSSPPIPT